ncbi:MAG: AraC family transcriptional regulator [Candidatus Limivivens sp.]|nr:AraC family transcriptional regulator [Candidatus Limivivens sp.]
MKNVYLVLEKYLDEEQKKLREKMGQPITMAVRYIREHYGEQISLEDVAEAGNVSGNYLGRLFKEEMGVGFHDYLTQVRLEESEKLLAKTNLTIKEIAFQVGYLDEKYYSKLFKKVTGIKPTEYRRIYS